ncbi:MAG: hypothetical protein A3F84_10695 [Candidatus Handelsmanbacteria bacterium RIFCSPLOWO2_12_FULL_64_10]|uniref:Uncharacterized protein n=1 Tax=Handelsmanbacteria sp. (strain RIFCSPLOWO2_12_FULL_64_10) TaxID=1817868 RepID=A0A1F6D5Z1_HANXR|nr:MAG: hypothetical protein A3F84_10695 [Candidatus Handelsmanbacteria bacterium RIFCSPLOWO2_12_FULL_64_10]
MGYMQVYRVGANEADTPLNRISTLLNGEGIDCVDLGNERPRTGCVLVDFTSGEKLVTQVMGMLPQLPNIVVTSTRLLGERQLAIADEFVSPDLPDEEIVRRVERMHSLATRIVEVPNPAHTRVLLDGDLSKEDSPLHDVATLLSAEQIEWSPIESGEEQDPEGTGIIYTAWRRITYAEILMRDFPGYIHIHLASTQEHLSDAMAVDDLVYPARINRDEVLARHRRFLHMLERLRNPDAFRNDPEMTRAPNVLFVGERQLGHAMKQKFGEVINLTVQPSVAGMRTEAPKYDIILIHLGVKDEARERLALLQLLLKMEPRPQLALLFLSPASDQIRSFCEKQDVAVIESKQAGEVQERLLELRKKKVSAAGA